MWLSTSIRMLNGCAYCARLCGQLEVAKVLLRISRPASSAMGVKTSPNHISYTLVNQRPVLPADS